jgi:ferredoxin-NADP reductase
MEYIVKLLAAETVTHDVKSFRVEKPEGYVFIPGQATEVSVNRPDWKEEKRPFTFTSLPDAPYLEFTIKRYPDHQGVTDQLHQLTAGDELILRDVWGAIEYKGPGYFIAGGAGITPFLAILRNQHAKGELAGSTLWFSNKTAADIIHEAELTAMLGKDVSFILTREEKAGYPKTYIDKAFLEQHITDRSKQFYICGPDAMVTGLAETLTTLGIKADAVVFEK